LFIRGMGNRGFVSLDISEGGGYSGLCDGLVAMSDTLHGRDGSSSLYKAVQAFSFVLH
jgi:hypothetical protein